MAKAKPARAKAARSSGKRASATKAKASAKKKPAAKARKTAARAVSRKTTKAAPKSAKATPRSAGTVAPSRVWPGLPPGYFDRARGATPPGSGLLAAVDAVHELLRHVSMGQTGLERLELVQRPPPLDAIDRTAAER